MSERRVLGAVRCEQLLREVGWGVLSVADRARDAAGPMGVPLAFALDADRLYFALPEGRERAALERNPQLCLTVSAVESLVRWRAVLVTGRVQWIDDADGRALAVAAFTRSVSRGGALPVEDGAAVAHARFALLEREDTVGYECEGPQAPHAADGQPVGGAGSLRVESTAAMNAIRRVVRALRAADAESEAGLGVSAAQLFVLRELARGGHLTVGELAARTATSQSSVSEVVTRLAGRGLLVKAVAPEDRRRASVSLTGAGQALLTRAPGTVQERMLAALERMPPDRRALLADTLTEWIGDAGLGELPATMFFEPVPRDAS